MSLSDVLLHGPSLPKRTAILVELSWRSVDLISALVVISAVALDWSLIAALSAAVLMASMSARYVWALLNVEAKPDPRSRRQSDTTPRTERLVLRLTQLAISISLYMCVVQGIQLVALFNAIVLLFVGLERVWFAVRYLLPSK
jgi:hypothetical protein